MVSRAAPTPVVDKNVLVAFFESGDIVALDHAGKKVWSRSLLQEFGDVKARHGIAASLEQDDRHVFVWVERMQSPYVMALKKSDGTDVWKSEGVGGTSWSSPRLINVGEQQHLVLSAMGKVAGYDPNNGETLWTFDQISGNSSSTPVPVGDGKFLIGSIGARQGAEYTPSCGVVKIEKTDAGYSAQWAWNASRATCSFGSHHRLRRFCLFCQSIWHRLLSRFKNR